LLDNCIDNYLAQFPALNHKTYFNYGGQGPLPKVALAAIQDAYAYIDQAGPFSNAVNAWITEEENLTRAAIAAELGVLPETISLTEDVTMGCNIALWGLDWQPGDHLLLSDCEHPGIVAAIQELQRRFQIKVSTCPLFETLNRGDPVACVVNHLQPKTRLVVLSHILWNTGQVLPLADIVAACHSYVTTAGEPVRVLVDAAQSVGVLPLDLKTLEVDFYAFTGHKWWCGPAGVGGLYVRPEALTANGNCLRPTFIGWRGIITDSSGNPVGFHPSGKRFEVATSAIPSYAGLRSAIALHDLRGTVQERYQQICSLSELLWKRLSELETIACLRTIAPPAAGLVSFQLKTRPTPQAHRQLVDDLEAQGILVRTLLKPSCVRACVHYLTRPTEVDRLVAAIAVLTA
jgi:L-cysteine/cystine lyase